MYLDIYIIILYLILGKNIMFENSRLRRGRMFSRSPVGYSFWLNPITLQHRRSSKEIRGSSLGKVTIIVSD